MLSPIFPFSPLVHLAQFVVVLSLLGRLVQAVDENGNLHITDIFNVKTTGTGSCNGRVDELNQWFLDSQAVASAPVTVASNAVRDVLDEATLVDMEYVGAFFGIPPPDDEPGSQTRLLLEALQAAQSFLKGEATPMGGKPWLYCSDGWQEEVSWVDAPKANRVYREEEGEVRGTSWLHSTFRGIFYEFYYNRADPATGDAINPQLLPYVPWWVEDLKQYFFLPSGNAKSCSIPTNLGSTLHQTAPMIVILCLDNDGKGRPSLLSDLEPVNAENALVATRRTLSLTLYHEVLHLIIKGISEDFTYEFDEIVGAKNLPGTDEKISPGQAILNPESYTVFALATYLAEKYPDYDFWSGRSKLKSA
ncbi:hypothetical protein B0T10DRAFT_558948 [Thelonectria olida]|uniref:Uncharacterized protein n=1 Tax=Thelonectria olida TaxID=1576542 RepID=A0A9P8W8V2_9HYPO|nr:hypothetical protein B0T10DRAFT_558948 [Thelonectria olida]